MIISYYGKKFLKKFNEIEEKKLTPKKFFIDIFYPLFYGGKKDLMFIQNSPFSNPANRKKNINEKLQLFFEKIEKKEFDSSMFVGGYANGLTSSTSFNLPTEYKHEIDENEVFYSWIGHALSVKLKGIDFLFDNENILYDVYLGWKKYNELLNNSLYEKTKGLQISTWNMHWLNHLYNNYPNNKFNPFETHKEKLESISWVGLLFKISNRYSDNIINAYAYKFGQTNETYGIIPIETKKIHGLLNLCKEYFNDNDFLNTSIKNYENIYGTGYGMEKICELGSIGFVALKPALLRYEEYKTKSEEIKRKIKKLYQETIENTFNYKLYIIYIMAKLNIKDIQEDTIEIANTLYNFKCNTRKNNTFIIEELLSKPSDFIKNMATIMSICTEEKLFEEAKIFNKFMNLFVSNETKIYDLLNLIKFQYHFIECKNKK